MGAILIILHHGVGPISANLLDLTLESNGQKNIFSAPMAKKPHRGFGSFLRMIEG
jgi:hypothetical protein